MARIIVLLNLKPGKSVTDYERWAENTDLPTVNGLNSVSNFEVLRTTGLLGGGTAPYQYVEIIDVADMALFGEETSTEAMGKVAAEFQDWADPIFIMTEKLGA
ncbi:REDY-like protein HapK [Novosphingobium gossypii]|uniref:REDY-like protein HapK n=1 Tax=Novosphingobium gossypii TaxID=1604774 RepID=UPI003D233573